MNTTARYLLTAILIIIGLHSILTLTHEEYGRATSISNIKGKLTPPAHTSASAPASSGPIVVTVDDGLDLDSLPGLGADGLPMPLRPGPGGRRANATLLMLARNSDVDTAIRSVRRLEDRFNRHFHYHWLFLNDNDFDQNFKDRISILVSGEVTFATIPREHWVQPDWIDEEKAKASRDKMSEEGVIYGGSKPYRNMCRFNSGFFFKHPEILKYRWYWRVEPDVEFFCDIEFDPFLFMEDNNKTYGFTISLYEYQRTIETLWPTVKEFMRDHPEHIASNNAMNFLSDNGGEDYNLCHFWSNFEIADMNLWRSPAYQAFFELLESKGGFYYERWGDAPVHSIAAALLQSRNQIHFFDEIGYKHNPYSHLPSSKEAWERGRCTLAQDQSFDYEGYSCLRKWDAAIGRNGM